MKPNSTKLTVAFHRWAMEAAATPCHRRSEPPGHPRPRRPMRAGRILALWTVGVGLSWCSLLSSAQAHVLDVWRVRDSGVAVHLFAAAWGNGIWVVAGDEGAILTSSDGTTWTRRESGTGAILNSMVFAAGRFVVVGDGGTILTSVNGIDWSVRDSGTPEFIYDVSYGQDTFIGVGASRVLTSPDGLTWNGLSEGSRAWYGVNYGNGNFVTVGGESFCSFFCWDSSLQSFSRDGSVWSPGGPTVSYYLSDLAFGNNLFVAVGGGGTVMTSNAGETWAEHVTGADSFLYNVAFGDGTFVAVGDPFALLSSADGENWAPRNAGTANGLFNAAYGDGTFLAVGASGTILQSHYFGPAKLSGPRLLPTGVELTMQGKIDEQYRLEATTDLSVPNWIPVHNFTLASESQTILDSNAAGIASRFYRVVPVP